MLSRFQNGFLKRILMLIIFQCLSACSLIPTYTNTAPANPVPSNSLRILDLTASYVDEKGQTYEHEFLPKRLYVKFPLMVGSFLNLSEELEFATVLNTKIPSSVDLGEISTSIMPHAQPFSSQVLADNNLKVAPQNTHFFRVASLAYSFRTGTFLGDAEFTQASLLDTQQLYLVYVDRAVIIQGELNEGGKLMNFDVNFNSPGFKWLIAEEVKKFGRTQLAIREFYDDSPKILKIKIQDPPSEIL